MSTFMLGAKAIKKLALEQNALAFFQAKFSPPMFKGEKELALLEFTRKHYDECHTLPTIQTLETKFPEIKEIDVPEPSIYYVKQMEKRFGYDLLSKATAESRDILKKDDEAVENAWKILRDAQNTWTQQKYRHKILDVNVDLPELLLTQYHGNLLGSDMAPAFFGWPYLDDLGGIAPAEVVSFVGRPATGKSYKMLYCALHNWSKRHENVLFVSMEMGHLLIGQRVGAMYTNTPVKQLMAGGFSSQTFLMFAEKITDIKKEPAKFYVIDGNLAASVDDIYNLALLLKCRIVFIDGAYMLRHPNPRLDRYTKVAENIEWIKRVSSDNKFITFCSWQFAKTAVTKKKQKGAKEGLEDIGYSDAIGQISALVIGIMQEEGVETIMKRKLELLKGRNGEIGSWEINWNFMEMDFQQVDVNTQKTSDELQYV
jgi:hypothetical protein